MHNVQGRSLKMYHTFAACLLHPKSVIYTAGFPENHPFEKECHLNQTSICLDLVKVVGKTMFPYKNVFFHSDFLFSCGRIRRYTSNKHNFLGCSRSFSRVSHPTKSLPDFSRCFHRANLNRVAPMPPASPENKAFLGH